MTLIDILLSIVATVAAEFTAPVPAPSSVPESRQLEDHGVTIVAANDYESAEVFFGAGVHVIELVGDGSTDVDFYVFDQFGHLVAFDEASGDFALLWVEVDTASVFRLVLINRGEEDNEVEVQLY